MIRPCRCSGTQSLVHTSCLNLWRLTSEVAKTRCSVCHFEYVTCKSPLANFLFSKTCHTIFAIAFILLFMPLAGLFFLKLQSRSSNWLFSLINTDSSPIFFRKILSFLPQDPRKYDLALFLHSIAMINPWWELCVHIDVFTQLMTEGTLQNKIQFASYYYACKYDFLRNFLYTFETGILAVSIAVFLTRQVSSIAELVDRRDYRNIALMGFGLCSLGNAALLRLGLFIGFAIAAKDIFDIARLRSQSLGFYLGEKILEPL